jgi:hypothetical protein
LKEEAHDRTFWRTQSGRGYGPVARETTTWIEFRCCGLWHRMVQKMDPNISEEHTVSIVGSVFLENADVHIQDYTCSSNFYLNKFVDVGCIA